MEAIALILDTMFKPCPHCHAAPLAPCTNNGRELRYTHTERNR